MTDLKELIPPPIIPVCIYHRSILGQGAIQGYLGMPYMTPDKSGKIKMGCIDPPVEYTGWYKAGYFYAINSMYSPIPINVKMICALQSKTAEHSYNTEDITTTYDPFHTNPNCVYFMTWTMPLPYTTPLFLYDVSHGILPSFEKRPDLNSVGLKTLFVLTENPMKNTIFAEKKNWFRKSNRGVPEFRFKNNFGRCVPDPDGVLLEECTISNNLNLTHPISLLDYLQKREKKKRFKQFSLAVSRFFKKVNTVVVSIVLGIFLMALTTVIIFFIINNGKSNGKDN